MPGKPGYKCAHTPQPRQEVQGLWWWWAGDDVGPGPVPAWWGDDEAQYGDVDDADSVPGWGSDVPPPSPGEVYDGEMLYSEPEGYLRATGALADLTESLPDEDFGTDAGEYTSESEGEGHSSGGGESGYDASDEEGLDRRALSEDSD